MLSGNKYNPDVLSCLANLSSDEIFTPPQMANRLLDLLPGDIWKNRDIKFLDPVCKTGVFLREIAKRLMKGLEESMPDRQARIDHIFKNQLYGISITEITALLSRRSVYCSKTANGKYSVCEAFDDEQGNILFERIEHTWDNGRCKYCGANREGYERGEELETHAYQFIHTENPEELFNMKFDVIVGNPPYQLDTGGSGRQAKPIYNLFIEQAKKLNPRYLIMITPSRWFAGGMGLDEFRRDMMNDERIREIVDYTNSKDCFPETSISGGVSYFLWEKDYRGPCKFVNIHNGRENVQVRNLNEFQVIIRYNAAINIIKKVLNNKGFKSISDIVSSINIFDLPSSFRGGEESGKGYIKVIHSKGSGFVKKSNIKSGLEYIGKYKGNL